MSSFSDNFDKTNKSEVQFDDAAFYPFIATILLFAIISIIIIIFKSFLTKPKYLNTARYVNCPCSSCKTKLLPPKPKFPYLYTLLLIIFSLSFYFFYNKILTTKSQFKSFDPYEILDIQSSTPEPLIKKAYKKLALKYHPDKNPNNLQAKARFILIAKAYDALTNEVSKKNYELYGNPDGKTSMRLSVGLPSFILEKKNHMKILIAFLFIIVIYIPMNFLNWYNNVVQYDKNDVMYKTNEFFTVLTDETSTLMNIPFYLGLAREFSMEAAYDFYPVVDGKEVNELYEIFKRFFPGINVIPSVLTNKNKRAICDAYAYLYHIKTMFDGSEVRMRTMARMLDQFLLVQIEKSAMLKQMGENVQRPAHLKMIRQEFIDEILLFQQCFVQGIRLDCAGSCLAPYLQFKQLNMTMLQGIDTKSSFEGFLKSDAGTKERFLIDQCLLSKEEAREVIDASSTLPIYQHSIIPSVDAFVDFVTGDIVTYSITITRLNLSADKQVGVGHSNSFPGCFNESLQIIVINGGNILQQLKVGIKQRETKTEFKLRLSTVGMMRLTFKMISTCYLGIDQEINVDIDCLPSSAQRKEQVMKIEAQKVKIEPSYFYKMLIEAGMVPNNDAEEDEEEEIEEDIKVENEPKEPTENKQI